MTKYRGVYFNDTHTASAWDAILNSQSISMPAAKTKMIAIDGRDGDLDLTESLTGCVNFENRDLAFGFIFVDGTYTDRRENMLNLFTTLQGKRVRVSTDDDPDWYYIGRCTVTDIKNDRSYGSLKVKVDADPWCYRSTETIRSVTVAGNSTTLVCMNDGAKTIIPAITVTGSITINGTALSAGTYTITTLRLIHGANYLTISGTGTVTITYREARF